MNKILEQSLDRACRAKIEIMKYPYYSDVERNAWLDAIDGMLDCQMQAYKNASESLENALKQRKI